MSDIRAWAREEFGDADLGDERRTQRLVLLAESCAKRPAGTITGVLERANEREGAFRFVENDRVDAGAIATASHRATARRLEREATVIVAVDQTSLNITDRVGKSGFGRVGSTPEMGRGLQVMTALAVLPNGITEGILAQQWWAREEKSPGWHHDKRPAEQRESDLWRRTILEAERARACDAPETRAWYQLDRGADSGAVLTLAIDSEILVTVRSAHDRVLSGGRHLHTSMRRRKPLGSYSLRLPKTPKRQARSATIALRAAPVSVRLHDRFGRVLRDAPLWCVHVCERGQPRTKRLEWWLLTTARTTTLSEAKTVVRNYTARWRVEEFHRAWKSGVCNIEDSQLRSADAFKRWATISAAVAARAERLKTASRSEPNRPATDELSRDELDAAILLSQQPHGYARGAELTLEQAVRLIAYLGGYIGKSSGGPPGARVIQRGLQRVTDAAELLEALRRRSD